MYDKFSKIVSILFGNTIGMADDDADAEKPIFLMLNTVQWYVW